jgi:hypothetical protein
MKESELSKENRMQIRRAGARYTPGLDPDAPNIEVEDLAQAIAFLGTHPSHRAHLRTLKQAVDGSIRSMPKRLERAFRGRTSTPAQLATILERLADAAPGSYAEPARRLTRTLPRLERILSRIDNELYQEELAATTEESKRAVQNQWADVRRVRTSILDVRALVDSPRFSLLTRNAMVLLGEWGTGKTHSLCDVTEHRMRQGMPTLFYLAHSLPYRRSPLEGLCQATGLAATPEKLLDELQRLGKAASCRALLIIDGINEGDQDAWAKSLRSIIRAVERRSHVGLIVSCRQPFDALIVKDRARRSAVTFEHRGFTDTEVDAQVTFFTYYDIPAPHAPLLTPEFSRPLFLKLLCESLRKRARRHKSAYVRDLASGQKGMTLVLEDFAKEVGRPIEREFGLPQLTCWRLLKGDRLEPSGPVLGLAPAMADAGREYLLRGECLDLIGLFTSWTSGERCHDLLQRLLADGLLGEGVRWTDSKPVPVIQFPYQRFGDHLIARHLLDRHLNTTSEATIRRSFFTNRPLGRVFDVSSGGWSYHQPGLASAIMLEFPERVKRAPIPPDERELVVYLPRARQGAAPLREVFLEGLYWRPADSFSRYTDNIISFYLNRFNESSRRQVLEVLVALATRAGHPYSAERLYRFVEARTMPDRDLDWSEFVRSVYGDSAVFRLIEWVERTEEKQRAREVAKNCVTLLSLFLTTTRRPLRDRATRALYLIGLEHPDMLFERTLAALEFNDPYVPERMLAASYGVAMSMWADPVGRSVRAELPALAKAVAKRMFLPRGRNRTTHVLMQDYALGIIELARRIAPRCIAKSDLRYLERPLPAVRSRFPSPARIDDDAAEAVKSAIHMDFGNYTMGRLLPDRGNYDFQHAGYRAVRRQILWRIANCGYSEKRFAAVDRSIARFPQPDLEPGRTDRYGKKYSWIAYFEMCGARLDAGQLRERDELRPSDIDIDPSFPREPTRWAPPDSGALDTAPSELRAWLECGVTPDYEGLLCRDEVGGVRGPWLLLEGWVDERAPNDKRRLFTFLWAHLVGRSVLDELVTRFRDREYPGNSAIPQPHTDYYTFAGEVPWSARFSSAMRGQPNGVAAPHLEAFPQGAPTGVTVEVPIVRWGWESYHSVVNQVNSIYYPAPALCDALGLVNHARTIDLYDQDGRQATLYTRVESAGGGDASHLLFIRKDLLARYLKKVRRTLVWFVWGERDLQPEALLSDDGRWSDIYQRYTNIHRRLYVWERARRARTGGAQITSRG